VNNILLARNFRAAIPWVLSAIAITYFVINCIEDRAQQRAVEQPASYPVENSQGRVQHFSLPPMFVDPDSACWLVYAHTLVERGEIRLRTSPIGNAPEGRPMLWAHLYLWWVIGLGGIAALFDHSSWIDGINKAIFWSNPLAFVLFATAWLALVRKHAGALASAVGLLFLCASPAISADFGWWHPDHHGFHLAAMLGALTAAVIGIKSLLEGDTNSGGRLLVTAGIVGGIGLWIGATQQVTVVAAIGSVGLAGALWIPRDRLAAWDSSWMRWAMAGALTSLFGFAVEFAPDLSDARLEVNHPVFAAAWFGGGLLIRGICRRRIGATGLSYALAGCLLLAALPTTVFAAPLSQYSLRDPVVLRCHELISEFRPGWKVYHVADAMREFGLGLFLIPAGIWLLWSRRRDHALRYSLGLALLAALGFGLLTVLQLRWASFFEACLVLIGVWLCRYAGLLPFARRGLGSVVALCVGLSIFQMCSEVIMRVRAPRGIRRDFLTSIGTRDLAVKLRRENGTQPVNVIGDSVLAPGLYAYGGVGAITALYWEDASGIHAAAEILTMQDDAEAERAVRARQVTHLVLEASPETVMGPRWIALGSRDPAASRHSLAWKLAKPDPSPPSWLRLESEQTFLGRENPTRIYHVLPVAEGS
jgi:hypothetical protein